MRLPPLPYSIVHNAAVTSIRPVRPNVTSVPVAPTLLLGAVLPSFRGDLPFRTHARRFPGFPAANRLAHRAIVGPTLDIRRPVVVDLTGSVDTCTLHSVGTSVTQIPQYCFTARVGFGVIRCNSPRVIAIPVGQASADDTPVVP